MVCVINRIDQLEINIDESKQVKSSLYPSAKNGLYRVMAHALKRVLADLRPVNGNTHIDEINLNIGKLTPDLSITQCEQKLTYALKQIGWVTKETPLNLKKSPLTLALIEDNESSRLPQGRTIREHNRRQRHPSKGLKYTNDAPSFPEAIILTIDEMISSAESHLDRKDRKTIQPLKKTFINWLAECHSADQINKLRGISVKNLFEEFREEYSLNRLDFRFLPSGNMNGRSENITRWLELRENHLFGQQVQYSIAAAHWNKDESERKNFLTCIQLKYPMQTITRLSGHELEQYFQIYINAGLDTCLECIDSSLSPSLNDSIIREGISNHQQGVSTIEKSTSRIKRNVSTYQQSVKEWLVDNKYLVYKLITSFDNWPIELAKWLRTIDKEDFPKELTEEVIEALHNEIILTLISLKQQIDNAVIPTVCTHVENSAPNEQTDKHRQKKLTCRLYARLSVDDCSRFIRAAVDFGGAIAFQYFCSLLIPSGDQLTSSTNAPKLSNIASNEQGDTHKNQLVNIKSPLPSLKSRLYKEGVEGKPQKETNIDCTDTLFETIPIPEKIGRSRQQHYENVNEVEEDSFAWKLESTLAKISLDLDLEYLSPLPSNGVLHEKLRVLAVDFKKNSDSKKTWITFLKDFIQHNISQSFVQHKMWSLKSIEEKWHQGCSQNANHLTLDLSSGIRRLDLNAIKILFESAINLNPELAYLQLTVFLNGPSHRQAGDYDLYQIHHEVAKPEPIVEDTTFKDTELEVALSFIRKTPHALKPLLRDSSEWPVKLNDLLTSATGVAFSQSQILALQELAIQLDLATTLLARKQANKNDSNTDSGNRNTECELKKRFYYGLLDSAYYRLIKGALLSAKRSDMQGFVDQVIDTIDLGSNVDSSSKSHYKCSQASQLDHRLETTGFINLRKMIRSALTSRGDCKEPLIEDNHSRNVSSVEERALSIVSEESQKIALIENIKQHHVLIASHIIKNNRLDALHRIIKEHLQGDLERERLQYGRIPLERFLQECLKQVQALSNKINQYRFNQPFIGDHDHKTVFHKLTEQEWSAIIDITCNAGAEQGFRQFCLGLSRIGVIESNRTSTLAEALLMLSESVFIDANELQVENALARYEIEVKDKVLIVDTDPDPDPDHSEKTQTSMLFHWIENNKEFVWSLFGGDADWADKIISRIDSEHPMTFVRSDHAKAKEDKKTEVNAYFLERLSSKLNAFERQLENILFKVSASASGSCSRKKACDLLGLNANQLVLILCSVIGSGAEMGIQLLLTFDQSKGALANSGCESSRQGKRSLARDEISDLSFPEKNITTFRQYNIRRQSHSIPAKDAGIILLHPFISAMLCECGYEHTHQEDAFKIKTFSLLYYIVWGKHLDLRDSQFDTADITVSLLLAGYEHTETTLADIPSLSDQDVYQVNGLLDAVKGHWPVIGRFNREQAFQSMFLQRQAQLEKSSNTWMLSVETKAHDIMLKSCPWGYTSLKLPWLKDRIEVTWKIR